MEGANIIKAYKLSNNSKVSLPEASNERFYSLDTLIKHQYQQNDIHTICLFDPISQNKTFMDDILIYVCTMMIGR